MAGPSPDDVALLHFTTRGGVVVPGSVQYAALVAKQHNAAFHGRKPALFVLCHDADDVSSAVTFATKHGLPVCVRSGGHSACGSSLKDGAVVIDLGNLNNVNYHADTTLVDVEPGATLGNINVSLMRYNRCTPVGVAPPTGSGGLILQGGIGFLMHKYGTSADQIVSLDIVLASGEKKHVDNESTGADKELFFAARGCAGSLGVVTKFTMRTYPQNMLTGGLWMLSDDKERTKARKLMKLGRNIVEEQEAAGARSTFGNILMANFPPSDDVPAELRGTPAVVVVLGNWGLSPESAAVLAPFVDGDIIVGKPPAPMPFGIFNQMMGVLFLKMPPFANYFAGGFADKGGLPDAGIDALADAWNAADPRITGGGFTGLELHGGVAGAKHGATIQGDNDHCSAHIRDLFFSVPMLLYYPPSPENGPIARKASLDIRAAFAPYHTKVGGYSNYNSPPEDGKTKELFQKRDITNVERVMAIKKIVDPSNIFARSVAV